MPGRELTDADIAWCARCARYWYWRMSAGHGLEYEAFDAACVDGMLRAQTTYDAAKGASWRTWLSWTMRAYVLNLHREERRRAARERQVVRELTRRHRQHRTWEPVEALRVSDARHDLAAFAAFVAQGRRAGTPGLRCLQGIAQGLRHAEIARAEGVTAGAIAFRLKTLMRQWRTWEGRGDRRKEDG